MLMSIILVTGLNFFWLILLDAARSLHYVLTAKFILAASGRMLDAYCD